jgi:hypothetical protein
MCENMSLLSYLGLIFSNSQKFGEAATVIDRLSVETRVLFWLILAMNAAVIGIFTLVYRNV